MESSYPIIEVDKLNDLNTEELRGILSEFLDLSGTETHEELMDAYIEGLYEWEALNELQSLDELDEDLEDIEDTGSMRNIRSRRTQKSLYERLGEIYNIASVIDLFSDALIENPIVGQESENPFLRDWHTNKLHRLPGLKWLRTLWLADISGGPYQFVGTKPGAFPLSLENSHKEFEISPEEFDAFMEELSNALDSYEVPEREKEEVLSVFASHKGDVNIGFF